MTSYLAELMLRLAAGARRLPEGLRRRHAAFLQKAQNEDGGFAGRQGPSDLYYTSFALRGLILLDALDEAAAARANGFLKMRLQRPLPSVEFLSLVFSNALLEGRFGLEAFGESGHDRTDAVTTMIDRYRRDDGGFAKTANSTTSSTYHSFLAVAARELVGVPTSNVLRSVLIELIQSRRRSDGGFVEVPQVRQSGASPTGAAVGLLKLLGAIDDEIRDAAVGFLAGLQTPEGGFRAHGRIPFADLLSTFTALNALADLDALDVVDTRAARQYAQTLALPDGGLLGGVWDDTPDVEYTFYGLGVLSLLTPGEEGH
ncbi:MAG: beta-hydroxylase [Pirellulales bacterium]|nr:beta-hydroxylase [Pirellulales bacterium]